MSKQSADKCGPVSHDEALNIAMAYIDHAFGNPERRGRRITHSIPANHGRDSDLRLTAYIEQQRQKDEARSEASGGWVPTSERMPEGEPRLVLAWCREGHARSVWVIPGPRMFIGLGPLNTPATHWREMPADPALPGAPHE